MKANNSRKGFTLVEMLVVIAIVAVLVAIIIPTVTSSTKKARAAADAANLRGIYGEANVLTLVNGVDKDDAVRQHAKCESFPDAQLQLFFAEPGFIGACFVDGSNYYDLDYFSEVAANGSSERSTALPENLQGAEVVTVSTDGE